MAVFPCQGLHRVGVVVRDLQKSMDAFSRFFGIEKWQKKRFEKLKLHYQGHPCTASFHVASAHHHDFAFELVQPIDGESLYHDVLLQRGEGMFSTFAVHMTEELWHQTLQEQAIGVVQSFLDQDNKRYYLDTHGMLGTYLEIRTDTGVAADETATFAASNFFYHGMPLQKLYHIGIVTPNRHATKAAYEKLFGMVRWLEFKIESGVTMTETTYYGKPVSHAYDNWVGRLGNFGVELIQVNSGDSVYKEMQETIGPGMHHVFPTICDPEAFSRARTFFAQRGMPIIQSGRIDGIMDYFYVDTRKELAGITTEVVTPLANDWLEKMFRADDAWILTG